MNGFGRFCKNINLKFGALFLILDDSALRLSPFAFRIATLFRLATP